jgi:hypothetical protein
MMQPVDETRDSAGDGPAESRRSWAISLPFTSPPLTYNEMMGKHWSVVHRAKRELLDAGFYLSRTKHLSGELSLDPPTLLPRPFTRPVTVQLVYWPGNNTVHDPDNLAPTLKYLVDGLRKAGVLTDDRGRYVHTASCTVIERDDDPAGRTDARMLLLVREL